MSKQTTLNLDPKTALIVSQSNNLVEANYSPEFTARAHKTARLILSLISPDDKDLRHYTVRISALKQYLGMNSDTKWGGFHKEIREIAERLSRDFIEVENPNGDYIKAKFLSGYKVSKHSGLITFEISALLKPHLLELKKNYTSYLLTYIPKLRSSYSIRMYELLYQYKKIGKRYFEVDDLQKKVGSNYQKKYNNFKRKVILQAQKDLKEHTDIAFAFDEKKKGRKIVGIEFIIFGNKPNHASKQQLSFLDDIVDAPKDEVTPALPETLVQEMNALGISEQNIAKYLAMGFEIIKDEKQKKNAIKRCEILPNYYLEKLELTKHSTSRENAAGFFIKALREDWTYSKTLQKANTQKGARERKAAENKLKQLENKIIKLNQNREKIKQPIITELLADDSILQQAYQEVEKGLGSFIKKHYAEQLKLPPLQQYQTLPIIASGIDIYLMKHHPERFKRVGEIETALLPLQNEIKRIKKRYPSL